MIATGKFVLFLGVFSGAPYRTSQVMEFDDMIITKRDVFDVGAIWYSDLIHELILSK